MNFWKSAYFKDISYTKSFCLTVKNHKFTSQFIQSENHSYKSEVKNHNSCDATNKKQGAVRKHFESKDRWLRCNNNSDKIYSQNIFFFLPNCTNRVDGDWYNSRNIATQGKNKCNTQYHDRNIDEILRLNFN